VSDLAGRDNVFDEEDDKTQKRWNEFEKWMKVVD
jgi:hypothetical protein